MKRSLSPCPPTWTRLSAEVDDLRCARGVWLLTTRLVVRILVTRFALEAPSSLQKVQRRRSRWDLHFVHEIRSDVDFSSPLSLRRLYDGSPPENASSFACRCVHVSITAQTSEGEEKNKNRSWSFFLSCCCRRPAIKSLPIVGNTFVFVWLSSGLDTWGKVDWSLIIFFSVHWK